MKRLCEVCKVNESFGVYSSACGPISFAYCVSCGRSGAEPIGMLAAYISGAVEKGSDAAPEKNMINPAYQSIIDVSIKVANVTREDFYIMIDEFIKKEIEYLEGLRDELNEFVGEENNEETHNKIVLKASKYLEGELNFDD